MGLKDIHDLDYAVVLGENRVETRAFYKDVLNFALEHDSEGKVSFRVGATLPIQKLEKFQRKIRRPTNPALAVVRECPACLFTGTTNASHVAITSMIAVRVRCANVPPTTKID